jgi:hypothetical protein
MDVSKQEEQDKYARKSVRHGLGDQPNLPEIIGRRAHPALKLNALEEKLTLKQLPWK